MSWQGYDRKIPNPRQEPLGDESRLAPAPRTRRKGRFAIEMRLATWRRTEDGLFRKWPGEMGDWRVLRRYTTESARDQALAKMVRVDHCPGRIEFRAGPSDE
jgi:hypothetical protein